MPCSIVVYAHYTHIDIMFQVTHLIGDCDLAPSRSRLRPMHETLSTRHGLGDTLGHMDLPILIVHIVDRHTDRAY